MSEQQQEDQGPDLGIADEAKFLQTIGINPAAVVKGSVELRFIEGRPHIEFKSLYGVPPHLLGQAFMAASPVAQMQAQMQAGPPPAPPADEAEPPPPAPALAPVPDAPGDDAEPAAKRPARKRTTPRKTAAKKPGGK